MEGETARRTGVTYQEADYGELWKGSVVFMLFSYTPSQTPTHPGPSGSFGLYLVFIQDTLECIINCLIKR
ncbi:MAG: hypothetical protein LBJ92_00090 [Holosporales bacterium]|nr:hypothetical protein [Holosporales bacterium]